jgi:hypothetical protein
MTAAQAAFDAAHSDPLGPLPGYVKKLLSEPRFSGTVVPQILFKGTLRRRPWLIGSAYILQRTKEADGAVYYLRKPCGVQEAVRVNPWWDLQSEVLVCPDSYRPTQFEMTSKRRCDTSHEADPPTCGCGPNLMRCLQNRSQQNAFELSTRREVEGTISYVVDHELPIETVFTTRESFRDRNVEFLYQRWRVEAGELKSIGDYRDWPTDGKWAPRYESAAGEHAGLLTTPQVLYEETDIRQRQKVIYDLLWCKDPISGGASAQAMLSLGSSNFQVRSELWRILAARPLCTNCHARLDYGMQFFSGFPDARVASHFDTAAQLTGKGPLYGDNIQDARGEAELSPHGFATLAVKQKEFGQCMVRDVEEYVFGHRSSPETRQALLAAFARSGNFRELMITALLRYAATWQQEASSVVLEPQVATAVATPAALAEAGVPTPTDPGVLIPVSPQLRSLLDRYCVTCHDEGERDLRISQIPRSLMEKMLNQVAWGSMPKNASGMPLSRRHALVRELTARLYSDPVVHAQADSYFLTWGRAPPVYPVSTVMNVIHSQAGATPDHGGWNLAETMARPNVMQYSPGFAAIVAIEALRACKAAGKSGDELDRCLAQASAPANFSH